MSKSTIAYDIIKYVMQAMERDKPPTKRELEEQFPGVKFKVGKDEDGVYLVEPDVLDNKK
jgi:hypothetical protein